MHCALWDISKYPAVTENVITLLKQEKALLFNTLQQNRTVGIKPRKETIMKARKPSGQILIIFETDLSQAKSLDEEKFTPIQKAVYDKLSENQKEQIKQGYGAVYRDIDTDTEICSFNMDATKHRDYPIILRDQL